MAVRRLHGGDVLRGREPRTVHDAPRRSLSWTVVPFALALVIAVHLLAPCAAPADDDPALVLARSCWGEAGLSPGECSAIGEVYRRRSPTGHITAAGIRAYSAALKTGHRQWVTELLPSGAEPEHWPQHLEWERWRPRWMALLAHARLIVAGTVEPPCVADHYGARSGIDAIRAARAGWLPVDCGGTANAFWRRR